MIRQHREDRIIQITTPGVPIWKLWFDSDRRGEWWVAPVIALALVELYDDEEPYRVIRYVTTNFDEGTICAIDLEDGGQNVLGYETGEKPDAADVSIRKQAEDAYDRIQKRRQAEAEKRASASK